MCDYLKNPGEPLGAELRGHAATAAARNYAETPFRPTLRDRLEKQQAHAQQEARTFERRQELLSLLEKNPDVARILDLIQELGCM